MRLESFIYFKCTIFRKLITATIKNVEKCTLTCHALHTHLRLTDHIHYTPFGFVDWEAKMTICYLAS